MAGTIQQSTSANRGKNAVEDGFFHAMMDPWAIFGLHARENPSITVDIQGAVEAN